MISIKRIRWCWVAAAWQGPRVPGFWSSSESPECGAQKRKFTWTNKKRLRYYCELSSHIIEIVYVWGLVFVKIKCLVPEKLRPRTGGKEEGTRKRHAPWRWQIKSLKTWGKTYKNFPQFTRIPAFNIVIICFIQSKIKKQKCLPLVSQSLLGQVPTL
jgi:hypothetical protein